MITPNEKTIIRKKVNSTASAVFVLWIGFITIGIFTLASSFIFMEIPLILFFLSFYRNPIFIIPPLSLIFSGRFIVFSIMDLSKNKKWTNSLKFIKHFLFQVATATIASLLTVIFYGANYFTNNLFLDFFLLFNVFILVSFFGFIIFSIFYLYTNVYGSDRYKWENYRRPNA